MRDRGKRGGNEMGWVRSLLRKEGHHGDGNGDGSGAYRRFPVKKYGKMKVCIGQGVSCKVYLHENDDGALYAVKSFVKKNLKDEDDVKAIEKEICIHRGVDDGHHVVGVIDSFKIRHGEEFMVVLEYLPCSLQTLYTMYGSVMAQADRLCYFKQVVDGLYYLQKNNIGHRDIKMENCGLDRNGNVKLIDFGSSTVGNVGYGMAGSPSYAAPEIHAQLKYDSFKCDVWSLGILLINMFYVSRQKWHNARHDNNDFIAYKHSPTVENAVYTFRRVANERDKKYLADKPCADELILRLLTVDVCQRIELTDLVHDHVWFSQIDCCRERNGAGHAHLKFIDRIAATSASTS